jgi:Icc-related predicted phosphoesterase
MATVSTKRARSTSTSPCSCEKRSRLAPTRFLIVSDTHDDTALSASHPYCDVLLHCGDLTENCSSASLSSAIKNLGAVKAELKLVIAGNHETSLDKDYHLSGGGEISEYEKSMDIVQGELAKATGVTFLQEGTHQFTLKSGATFRIFASPYTPADGLYAHAFQYPSEQDRFNPPSETLARGKNVSTEQSEIPHGVDIVMTHGPPKYILDNTADGRSAGCEHLRKAIARVRPKLHCFGHIHREYGAQRLDWISSTAAKAKTVDLDNTFVTLPREWVGKNQAKRKGYSSLSPGAVETMRERSQTLMVNAAIMVGEDEPNNMPWIVDLDLEQEC